MDLIENNATTTPPATGAGCTPINLQPVPLWFVAFLIGPVFLVTGVLVRLMERAALPAPSCRSR